MSEGIVRANELAGKFNNINISAYDKIIKRKGFLSRCEVRVMFEKIVIIQNETIKALLKHERIFEYFSNKVSESLDNERLLDLVHFDADELGELKINEILDVYKSFFEMCENAKNFQDIENIVDMVKFSSEFFQEIIENCPPELFEAEYLSHKILVIDIIRNNIFEHNIALAIKHTFGVSHSCQFLSGTDLIQESMIGLKKAIEKYNPYLGIKLSTVALPWINAEVTRAIDNKERTIAVPCNILGAYKKSIKRVNSLINKKGKILGTNELVVELEDPSFYHIETQFVNMDAKLSNNNKGGAALSLHEIIPDDNHLDGYSLSELVELRNNLKRVINKLPKNEKVIIESLFGLGDEGKILTNNEIMNKLSVKTYEYNKIKNSAYSLLREEIETTPLFNSWQTTLESA